MVQKRRQEYQDIHTEVAENALTQYDFFLTSINGSMHQASFSANDCVDAGTPLEPMFIGDLKHSETVNLFRLNTISSTLAKQQSGSYR